MPTIKFPKNPNVDTAFVEQDDGTKNRALMIAPQDISTLELPNNPNSTKGYITVDGQKQRVILTADITGGGGGGGAVSSVNGKTGAVVLDAEDVGASPAIDWAVKIDLPANEMSSGIYYTFADGLPDGEYEFYTQTKCTIYSLDAPYGEKTCKVVMNKTNGQIYAQVRPVIDGNWWSDMYLKDTNNSSTVYMVGNDLVLPLIHEAFTTNIHDYDSSLMVPECFKISAVKNTGTGVEYTPTGSFTPPVSPTDYLSMMLYTRRIDVAPNIQEFYSSMQFDFTSATYVKLTGFDLPQIGVADNPTAVQANVSATFNEDKFEATLKLYAGEYILTVQKATGVFENTQIVYSAGFIYLKINAPLNQQGQFTVCYGLSGAKYSANLIEDTPSGTETALLVTEVGGTINTSNLGMILQYTDATDANYTNGYFYKATGTAVTTPADITISNMSPNDFTLNISDVDSFVSALATTFGWELNYVKQQFANGTSLSGYWDSDNDVITVINIGFMGDITDQTILSYVSISTTGTYTGEINFYSDAVYVPVHTEIQNGSWVRVDVQPGGSLPSQTGNAGKFLTTDGTDASWSDKPLVNNMVEGLGIYGETSSTKGIAIGARNISSLRAQAAGSAVAMGDQAKASTRSIAIGSSAEANSGSGLQDHSIAIGLAAKTTAIGAIQLGGGRTNVTATNSDANTFKVANTNGNFEIMSADGTIPAARHASLPAADGTYVLKLVIASGVPTLSWVAE